MKLAAAYQIEPARVITTQKARKMSTLETKSGLHIEIDADLDPAQEYLVTVEVQPC
jgi:hypothetical protein